MENELLEKVQMMVDSGLSRYVVHAIVDDIQSQLTPEQFKPIENLHEFLPEILEKKPCDVKKIIAALVDMSKKGAIRDPG